MAKNIHRFSPAAIIRTMIGMIGLCFLQQPLNAQNPAFFSPIDLPKIPPEILKNYAGIGTCAFFDKSSDMADKSPNNGILVACPLLQANGDITGFWFGDLEENGKLVNSRLMPKIYFEFKAFSKDEIFYSISVPDDSSSQELTINAFDKKGQPLWIYPMDNPTNALTINHLSNGKLAVFDYSNSDEEYIHDQLSGNIRLLTKDGKLIWKSPVNLKIPLDGKVDPTTVRIVSLPKNRFVIFAPVKTLSNVAETSSFIFYVLSEDNSMQNGQVNQQQDMKAPPFFIPGFDDFVWTFTSDGYFVAAGFDRPAYVTQDVFELKLASYDFIQNKMLWSRTVDLPQPKEGLGVCDIWGVDRGSQGDVYLTCDQIILQDGEIIPDKNYDQFTMFRYDAQGNFSWQNKILGPDDKPLNLASLYQDDERLKMDVMVTIDKKLIVIFSPPHPSYQLFSEMKTPELSLKDLNIYAFQLQNQ